MSGAELPFADSAVWNDALPWRDGSVASDRRLHHLTEAIAYVIHGHLPGLRDCRAMSGRLDIDELKRRGVAAPAVLVTRLGTEQATAAAGPHRQWTVRLAAVIVCKDTLDLPREEAATNIAQVLLELIPDQDWGLPGWAQAARDVVEQPLDSAEGNKDGITMIGVFWKQTVALAARQSDKPAPIEIYVGSTPFELTGGTP